jgi:hypothetical protein
MTTTIAIAATAVASTIMLTAFALALCLRPLTADMAIRFAALVGTEPGARGRNVRIRQELAARVTQASGQRSAPPPAGCVCCTSTTLRSFCFRSKGLPEFEYS